MSELNGVEEEAFLAFLVVLFLVSRFPLLQCLYFVAYVLVHQLLSQAGATLTVV
jgi:hypothetical protein